jgi:formamidopyrimidine-DNA glycosylase
MPELPEVETVRRQLQEALAGARIDTVLVHERGRELPAGELFVRALVGEEVVAVERRAKLLLWRFLSGKVMIGHLKMTGRFVFVEPGAAIGKHERISFVFADGRVVRWADVRKFGYVRVYAPGEVAEILAKYGPEPLENSAEELAARLCTPKGRSVKGALLNQGVVAGCGNIYADEACFRAGVLPMRTLGSLSTEERLRIMEELQSVLRESLAQKGTSAHDYVDTQGERGGFLSLLRVYGRKGQPCVRCGQPVQKVVHVGRGTHYCAHCQK